MVTRSRIKKALMGFIIFALISLQILSLTLFLVAYKASLERSLAIFLSISQFLLILKYLVKKHHESNQQYNSKIGPVITVKKYQIEAPSHSQTYSEKLKKDKIYSFIFTAITCLILMVFVILCLVHPLSYLNKATLFLSIKAVFLQDGFSTFEGWAVLFELGECIAGAAFALINFIGLIYRLLRVKARKMKKSPNKQASKIKTDQAKHPPCIKMSSQFLIQQCPQTSNTDSFGQTNPEGYWKGRKKHSSSESLFTVKKKQHEKLFKIPEVSEKEEQNTNYSRSKRIFYSQTLNPNTTFFSNCFLCLGQVTSQDVVYRVKGCFHLFHIRCISEWDRKFLPMRDFCPECLQRRKN